MAFSIGRQRSYIAVNEYRAKSTDAFAFSHPQIFDYSGLQGGQPSLLPVSANTDLAAGNSTPSQANSVAGSTGSVTPASISKSSNRRSWHEYGRNSDVDKIQISKL